MVEPESSTLQAYDLTTEHRTDPIGIDESAPILAWRLAGSGRDRSTSAYRIRVVVDGDPRDESEPGELAGPDPDRVVWDSGVVEAPNVVQIAYAGNALEPRTRYRWAVRVVDESGHESEWSEPASFETAPGAADWAAAHWIGTPEGAEPPVVFPTRIGALDLDTYAGHHNIERIGLPGGDARPVVGASFRHAIGIPEQAGDPVVRLLADGGPATSVRAVARDADGVETELACDGSPAGLQPGGYTLVVEVTPDAGSAGPAPALSARFEVEPGDGAELGGPVVLGTDGTWEVAEAGSESYALAWSYGLHGAPPWGRSPATYRPSPLLRRDFELSAPIRRARLHVSALGLYEARINGERVGDDHLAPGWTDYASRVPFRSYDVTHLLEPGANTIGAVLADGWYAGSLCWLGRFQYGDRRALRALLDVELADGSRTTVATDPAWSVGEGEIRYADPQNGTVTDRRLEPAGWDAPGFPAQQWVSAESIELDPSRVGPLEAAVAPPIRVLHEVPARSVERRPDGRQLVDFGENIVGWVRISLRGKGFEPGHRVTVRHAEVLDHAGELYLEALRSARATDEFFLRGKDSGDEVEVLEPRFTVHGFRFAEISGVPDDLDSADLTARVVHADMTPIGTFSCSDERLNRLQDNIVRGQRGNFLAVPTDCPQRDERLGWTGDAQVFAPTAAYNYDVRAFLRSWLRALQDGQHDDGAIPHVAPDVLSALGREGGAAGWGDAIVLVPYALYQAYDDLRPAVEAYDAIARWLDFLTEHSTNHVRPDEGFNDWLAITPTPKALVSTAFFAYAASVAAKLAETLDRDTDAERWRELFSLVRKAFRDRFVRGGGVVVSGTQAAYVLALHVGLLEPDEIPRATDRLVDEIAARNWHLTTGFLGTPYLLDVLTDNDRLEAAYRLLTQESCPSWLYPVVHGDATTIWERWDSWSDARGFQDPGMTSFNHYAYGAVGDWIYRTVGGLAPGAPGYRRIVVRPRPGGGITHAKATLDTPYGRASTSWRLQGNDFRLELEVPVGATAEVWLPGDPADPADTADAGDTGDTEPRTVGSGSYVFDTTLGSPSTGA